MSQTPGANPTGATAEPPKPSPAAATPAHDKTGSLGTADAPPPVAPPAPGSAARLPWRPARLRRVQVAGVSALALIAAGAVMAAWRLPPFDGGGQITDNAYVRGRTTVIAPQVSGYVVQVAVRDYQTVQAGQILARVDDRTYRARVDQAKANLDAAIATLANSHQARSSKTASLEGQNAGLANALAQLQKSRADMARVDALVGDGWVSVSQQDQTRAALRQAEAQVRQAAAGGEIARQDILSVDVGRGGLEAQVEAARAQLRQAEVDLSNTVIRAPEAGQVGEVGVRLGQYVTNGTQLVSLVPRDRWVIANFKEVQTAHMAVGQRASFTIDALGGARLTGRVEQMSPAAGSEFAVLKPDNATGNFIKVPQRIGVRIAIVAREAETARLRPGMSVEVRVETGR